MTRGERRMAFRARRLGPKQRHRPGDGLRKRLARPGGVAADEVQLKGIDVFLGDGDATKGAKAGINAVNELFAVDDVIHQTAGMACHGLDGLRTQRNRGS